LFRFFNRFFFCFSLSFKLCNTLFLFARFFFSDSLFLFFLFTYYLIFLALFLLPIRAADEFDWLAVLLS